MNTNKGMPTKRVTITVDFPEELVLPVDLDQGTAANGFTWQRFLDYQTLDSMGLRVRWQDQHGQPVDRDLATGLIRRMEERAMQADASRVAGNDPT